MCLHIKTKVTDSRKRDTIVRRRECLSCHERFTTYEYTEDEIEDLRKVKRRMEALRLYVTKN